MWWSHCDVRCVMLLIKCGKIVNFVGWMYHVWFWCMLFEYVHNLSCWGIWTRVTVFVTIVDVDKWQRQEKCIKINKHMNNQTINITSGHEEKHTTISTNDTINWMKKLTKKEAFPEKSSKSSVVDLNFLIVNSTHRCDFSN